MDLPNISVISQPVHCRKLIQALLCETQPSCLPVVFKMGGLPRRQISLIGIEFNGKYIVFDLRTCPDIVLEGHLYRLFISPDIVKVIHSTGQELLKLSMKHNIITRCLFDTHKAFDYLASVNKLPCRRIGIACLQAKLNHFMSELDIDESSLSAILTSPLFVDDTGLDWNKRPLTQSMLLQTVAQVGALKKCYEGLSKIGSHYGDIFELMQDRPTLLSLPNGPPSEPQHQVDMSVGIRLGLLDIGQSLLSDALPLAHARNVPLHLLDT